MKALDLVLQRWRIREAAAWIPTGARVLDIGTCDGSLFRQLTDIGPSAGIDLELDEASLPSAPHLTFYRGLFPAALPEGLPFDVITMLATLEHIPAEALDSLARDCAAHLRTGGLLVITVPSPAVDHVLSVLQAVRLIDGMATEQHYGYDVGGTQALFESHFFSMRKHRRFQLGLNNLFIFERK